MSAGRDPHGPLVPAGAAPALLVAPSRPGRRMTSPRPLVPAVRRAAVCPSSSAGPTRHVVAMLCVVVAATWVLAAQPASAQGRSSGRGLAMHAEVTPLSAKLGERVVYRGYVLAPSRVQVKFTPPASAGELSWSQVHARRARGLIDRTGASVDTVELRGALQVFRTGVVDVPGA